MKAYNISYKINSSRQDISDLFNELQNTGKCWNYLANNWLVSTSENANQLHARFKPYLGENDFIFIIEVGKDYDGWLAEQGVKLMKEIIE